MKYLINTEQPECLYIIKAFVTITPIAFLVAILLHYFYPDAETIDAKLSTYSAIFIAVLINPIIETFIMIPILAFCKMVCRNHILLVALLSAIIWASLHCLLFPARGIVSFFTFFVLSLSFISWDKVSRKKAILVTFTIHALNNATAVILYNLS